MTIGNDPEWNPCLTTQLSSPKATYLPLIWHNDANPTGSGSNQCPFECCSYVSEFYPGRLKGLEED